MSPLNGQTAIKVDGGGGGLILARKIKFRCQRVKHIHSSPIPTYMFQCFYTIFTESIVLFAQELYAFCNVVTLKKVKCTLVQALRLCTGRMAHRGSRGIALTFLDHGTRRGWGVSVTPRPLFTPGKDLVPTVQDCTGGWVGPRAGLDRCEKSHPHRDSIPRPFSP